MKAIHMKRGIFLMVVVLVATLLAACGGNRTVNEPFPAVAAPTTAPAPTAAPAATTAPAPTAAPVATTAPAAPVATTAPAAPVATTAPAATIAPTAVPTAIPATAVPTAIPATAVPATAVPSEPVLLKRGSFVAGSVPGDTAEGQALIYRLPDGSLTLRLENFAATNGPDLFVVFSGAANPEQEGLDAGGSLQLAALKGNRGNQNYELPADLNLDQFRSVVIWCRAFNIVFGYATLEG